MGFEYAFVHLKYTIPPAIALTLFYRPLLSRRDVYRLLFLVTIAVVATIPWDSYLIRHRIWSYPPNAVLGPTLFQIPLEELFFFVIQTYDVSVLYIVYTKSDFYPAYLKGATLLKDAANLPIRQSLFGVAGQLALFLTFVQGWQLVQRGGQGTYLGLIAVWALPFVLFLWTISNTFMLRLPVANVLLPITVPTLYLWMVDTFSLQRGTWVIEDGTKCGIHLWNGLEIEEAFFFFITNVLIVFGQIAFDNAVTIIDSLPEAFPEADDCPSPMAAMRALMLPRREYDNERIAAFDDAMRRLQEKSRSFYLASAMFEGRLRIDLVLLYSFCRVADDLIDDSKDVKEARVWIDRLHDYLDLTYASRCPDSKCQEVRDYVQKTFPKPIQPSLLQLPASKLSKEPLYDLLRGFEMDLIFTAREPHAKWPIHDEATLKQYGKYVAGTVAELCCDLVFHRCGQDIHMMQRLKLKDSAVKMGIALQTVNIARDIQVDAALKRVYIPTQLLKEAELTPEDVLHNPDQPALNQLRTKLLDMAFEVYGQTRPAIEELPVPARGPMRVAIESYMEIGRVLRAEDYKVKHGRATVPIARRLWVAWRALNK